MLEIISGNGVMPVSSGIEIIEAQRLEGELAVSQSGLELLQDLSVATPIHVGRCGAVGFGIMVRKLEEARPSFFGSDRVSGHGDWDDLSRDEQVATGMDSATHEERARHFGTRNGFMIVRQTLLPSGLANALRTERFIGPAMIDKCAREVFEDNDSLGEDYDHYLSTLLEGALSEDSMYSQIQRLTDLIIESLGNYQLPIDSRLSLARSFASWHGYPYYHSVIGRISGACRATVENFDQLTRRFQIETPQFALKA
jgi:hypothetical protein